MVIGSNPLHHALRSGLQAYEANDLPAALASFRHAVALAPDHPGARHLLGTALLTAGQPTDAIAELERAAQLAKSDPAILGNLAQAYTALGRHAEAHQAFRKASRIAPRHLQYAEGAAIALAQQGNFVEAEPLLQRLTARFPENASPWYNLGNMHRERQQWPEAERCYREALNRAPDDPETHNNLGNVLHAQLHYAGAENAYRACIAAQPDYLAAHLNLISVLIDGGRFTAAEDACHILLARAPQLPEAHRFLAATLSHQAKTIAALPAFARAATLAPDDPVSQRGYGGALAEAGYMHQALRILAKTVHPHSDANADAQQQLLSSVLLAQGLYADGWSAYRRRAAFLRFSKEPGSDGPAQTLPADTAGKHILILREQGIGDELFFLRYAPLLRARGAKVTLHVSAKIATLVARAGCADAIVTEVTENGNITEDRNPVTSADVQILCGDLPYVLGTPICSTIAPGSGTTLCRDFAMRIGAFFPLLPATLRIPSLPDALARIRQRLQQFGLPPYLGITWRAGTAARDQTGADWVLSKEIPLPALAHSLRNFRGTLLALQRNTAPGEIAALAAGIARPVHDCTDLNNDLEGMLALLEVIDDYVGVSNTNMHLRAATGRTARVLVPNPAEWRWMAAGRQSPWFPDFSIYRQSLHGDWTPALQTLAHDLQTGF